MRVLLTILLVAGLATEATAEVFRWTDESGVVHYAEHPPAHISAVPLHFTLPEAEPSVGLRAGERAMLDGLPAPDHAPTRARPTASPATAIARLCRQSRDQERQLRERMRSGYKAHEYNGLMAAAQRLRREQKAYCR